MAAPTESAGRRFGGSGLRFNPFDRKKDATSTRKTVTFGDAAEVRGSIVWTLGTIAFIFVIWLLATQIWGMPQDWQDYAEFRRSNLSDTEAYRDRQFLLDCDKAAELRVDNPTLYETQYGEFEALNGELGPCSYTQGISEGFLPGPRKIWDAGWDFVWDGYREFTFFEHLWASFSRMAKGLFWGSLAGIAIGLAMGLSDRARGAFDPIVESLRPIPPLALIPLFIIWFGIGEEGKVNLLIFAAIWIMIIATRSGVLAVNTTKVHAAFSLGASKAQVLRHVILPNALPEIFTGIRVATGVCWGTLVAAELIGASAGLGFTIFAARQFNLIDIMIAATLVISVLGVAMDLGLRAMERRLIPWRGKG